MPGLDVQTLSYVLVGIAVGSVYAMAALGLVFTYKATGVFNFAHAPVSILVAYVFWQTRTGWGWPLLASAVVSLLIVAPGIGLVIERVVFRPLERAGASTATKLAATMGLFVFVLGIVIGTWGGTAKNAPSLFPMEPFKITSKLSMGQDQILVFVVSLAISGGLFALLRFTRLGISIRAVVDRRELAELSSVNANRVSAFAWAVGTFLAGLAGILLAPRLLLDPVTLLLVVLGSYACAVGGRLSSLPWTYATAIILSVADSLTIRFGSDVEFWRSARPQYFFVAFLVLSIVLLNNVKETGGGVVRTIRQRAPRSLQSNVTSILVVGAALVALPLVLRPDQIGYAQKAMFFSVIFLSLVTLTGFTGQLNLGVAGFAGLGAFGSARLAADFGVPELLAIPLAAALVSVTAGVAVGFFAVRRRGLVLGMVTLAFGVLMFSFAFQNLSLTGGVDGSRLARPAGFESERGYYFLELAFLGLLMVFARNLRSGRLGRILTALRDSETGAASIGLSLARYKLFIFAASAFIAGVGGGLLGAKSGSFSFGNFDPFSSLQWFTVVVVAGIGSVSGALVAGVLFALAPAVLSPAATTILIGVGALWLGRTGNGLVGLLGDAWDRFRRPTPVRSVAPRRRAAPGLPQPSPRARQRLAAVRSAREESRV
ncbi:MAG TPA: ABC transporter permease [Acidimicrobiales bacterium]|nr:ABC transporter permease [Acidimicrobiales bacterium]